MKKRDRSSYPAVDNPSHLLDTMQFLKTTPVPVFLSHLTQKLSDTFPILYEIRSKHRLTSDHFSLLLMMGLSMTENRPLSWCFDSFAKILERNTSFSSGELMKELQNSLVDMKRNECEACCLSVAGLELLKTLSVDERGLKLQYFRRFISLEPPYFRYIVQHQSLLRIHKLNRKDLEARLFAICKEDFNDFAFDDVNRLIGWTTYFGIIQQHEDNSRATSSVYSFNAECAAQYFIETITSFMNETSRTRSNLIWKDLREDLKHFVIENASFLSIEGLLEVVLDQNIGRFRWGYMERGTSRYPGFKRDPAKQVLQIVKLPLSYEFSPSDVMKVIVRRQ